VLTTAVTALPILATAAAQVRAVSQQDSFRIRRLNLTLPTLPPALDGLTIAHLSDLHVGRFTNGPVLDEIAARTAALDADLVAFTGDLIDHALSDLPDGLAMLQQTAPRERLFMCEGNHDLFEGRREFERRVRRAGGPLLVNESDVRELRGHRIQILGLRWTGRGGSIDDDMDRVLPLRRSDAFTILLAHHPHAFDRAADAGIPLTLAGHTHGGQLMLNDDLGAGPVLFKYWSGLYRKGPSALAVSNGVGNWFPLRINAPAEILHLTLRAEAV
jgi:predicted MPP superfamily phosphohydrolase